MRRLTLVLLQMTAVLVLFGCDREIELALENIDVQFKIKEYYLEAPGTKTIEFDVIDQKAPRANDMIVLNGPQGLHYCKITDLSQDAFTIRLYDNFANGEHSISVQRGLSSVLVGKTDIIIEKYDDGVHPIEGSTVYGKVFCGDEPIKNVVISDGVNVTTTDENGIYQLDSEKKYRYVFVSVPSGYEVSTDIVFPQMWQPLVLAKRTPERIDFELYKAKDQTNFKLLVFGDMHLADRGITKDRAQFKHFLEDVDSYRRQHTDKPLYGLTLGDMTWDKYWTKNKYSFPQYMNEMKPLSGMQIYQTVGNHDHDIEMLDATDFDFATIQDYHKNLGPSYYSFNIGKVHFVSLDNILRNSPEAADEYYSRITSEQLSWLEEDLKHVSKSSPLIISMHSPMLADGGTELSSTYRMSDSGPKLVKALEGFSNVHIFSAHTHVLYHAKVKDKNIYEHNAGAICATWWWSGHYNPGVSVSQDGAPGGYNILEFEGKKLKNYQYKAIKQPVDVQFYTYDRNQISFPKGSVQLPNSKKEVQETWNKIIDNWKAQSTKNEVYIDIWNWEPGWKLEVKENGKLIDQTKIQVGKYYNPLHILTHSAHKPDGKFATELNCVLHKVQTSSPTSTLTITVTDKYGNTYTEEMKRPKSFNAAMYTAY